ncbi:carboxymuconolactone decarboxylase family protein [Pseudodesulfovibrio sp. zrk46]|uniref:carboxymuconolactone decarboxylase family protein n=1 Tax=Pseudodesulfovibrio sp. zrk46 TaxID=2725288 RepID=UPI00144980E1|nr:carboxymuconolactone decarboxylase family protein [Pseudodesulfovibrio sp. zrk46]QJB57523.1 carboxymuconolactone decarboxylase [Pseudodesulfovibrio sp. zrk46]
MRRKKSTLLWATLIMAFVFSATTEAGNMNTETTLDPRQRAIVTIAAFTTNGDIERLKPALIEGLEAGLTVNEVKEVLVQMYAYAGFPRSLGGIWTFMSVMDERKVNGIKDEEGKDASPIPVDLDRDTYGERVRADLAGIKEIPTTKAPYQEFSPIIDTFLKEHLFADIFARDILTHQERELATIACLASLGRAEGPLNFHIGAAMNTGLSEGQMNDFIKVLENRVGKEEAKAADGVLYKVLAARK